jgi:hypothetical protein
LVGTWGSGTEIWRLRNIALQTRFVDPQHLQTSITQQTLVSLGATPGSQVQISVMTPELSPVMGCPVGTNSTTLALVIH